MVKETKRMNLKELKDVLNKLPKEYLEDTSIAWDICMTDQPDDEFCLVTLFGNHYEDEGDSKLWKIWESKNVEKLNKRFMDFLNKDLKQARIREGEKGYDDEYNMECDW